MYYKIYFYISRKKKKNKKSKKYLKIINPKKNPKFVVSPFNFMA